ncbi:hypothetical protein F5884DRAFT_13113 [Xylogone sp. PMI_703]|nr:hypothetical protein F5884DRAFT_13113 [Xylogone sp. PMI_703]
MALSFPRPRLTKTQQNVQLSYELPHRIHTAKLYPLPSPNGSTILIYGHEYGVRIVWRGGRAFKATQAGVDSAKNSSNGPTKDAVISLDSDDEGDAQPFEDKPEFEDEEDKLDASNPSPKILQVLDLHFGTDVLDIALLPSSLLHAEGASWQGLESIKEKIVLTAACGDNNVRLVTVPLVPPSPASKARPDLRTDLTAAYAGKGKWGETVVLLSGHQTPSSGVSMTADLSINIPQGRSRSQNSQAQLVIASHSSEITGALLLWQVAVPLSTTFYQPSQKIYLPSPATCISFNPALSGERTRHLLVADKTGTCRIYDYKPVPKGPSQDDAVSEASINEQGSWLLSLSAGFKDGKSAPQNTAAYGNFGRKSILDAKWVVSGKAIIILLQDGEWAIWDIEGVGPGASQGLLGRQGIRGGSHTEYSISGWIDTGIKPAALGTQTSTSSRFAPMTPGTRKSVDPFLNRGPKSGQLHGQISVVEVPSRSPTTASEESVLFWIRDSFAVIPSLARYWVAASRRGHTGGSGNLFNNNNAAAARLIKLDGVDLRGEWCCDVDQLPRPASAAGIQTEILVVAEHRFMTVSVPKQTKAKQNKSLEDRLAVMEMNASTGELDVVGIDRALDMMENGSRNENVNGNGYRLSLPKRRAF